VAGALLGILERTAQIGVAGGSLLVHWDAASGHVTLAGPAAPVYRGTISNLGLRR
jgi:diaminopimelate epimerase